MARRYEIQTDLSYSRWTANELFVRVDQEIVPQATKDFVFDKMRSLWANAARGQKGLTADALWLISQYAAEKTYIRPFALFRLPSETPVEKNTAGYVTIKYDYYPYQALSHMRLANLNPETDLFYYGIHPTNLGTIIVSDLGTIHFQ